MQRTTYLIVNFRINVTPHSNTPQRARGPRPYAGVFVIVVWVKCLIILTLL